MWVVPATHGQRTSRSRIHTSPSDHFNSSPPAISDAVKLMAPIFSRVDTDPSSDIMIGFSLPSLQRRWVSVMKCVSVSPCFDHRPSKLPLLSFCRTLGQMLNGCTVHVRGEVNACTDGARPARVDVYAVHVTLTLTRSCMPCMPCTRGQKYVCVLTSRKGVLTVAESPD